MSLSDWAQFQGYILQLEQEGLATRTFRRLDPERQQMVLNAILDEAAQRGPAAMNIKNVAQRAGVSVGSLYQYFGDREHMFNFAIELCVRYTVDTFNVYRPYLLDMPLREALSAYLTGGIEWSQTQAGLIQLFARAAYQGDPELAGRLVVPIAATLRDIITAMLEGAAQRGELRPDIDMENTARLIHALMIVAGDSQLLPYLNNYFQVVDPTIPPERTLEALLDLILKGISARPPAAEQDGLRPAGASHES